MQNEWKYRHMVSLFQAKETAAKGEDMLQQILAPKQQILGSNQKQAKTKISCISDTCKTCSLKHFLTTCKPGLKLGMKQVGTTNYESPTPAAPQT